MTVRSFEADELVQLPRMTTTDSMALATALLTRAAAVPELPPAIARARGRMQQALDRVHESAESRVQERGQSDAKDPANRALDATWASLRWWSKAWTLLPHPEHASQADTGRMLETVLFPDGLRFTQLAFRDQWVESQSRLGLIEKEGLEPVITGLGGGSPRGRAPGARRLRPRHGLHRSQRRDPERRAHARAP